MSLDNFVTPNLDEIWPTLTNEALGCPPLPCRGDAQMRELTGVTIRIPDASLSNTFLWHPARRLSPVYAAAELLWYLGWSDDGDMIASYAPSYYLYLRENSAGRFVADGAYGYRWREQFPKLLAVLEDDENTRQAVIGAWNGDDLGRETKDMPCTLTLQFLRRGMFLDTITTMRSNDLWTGFPYDVWCFTAIQHLVAAELECHVGFYQHQVGSLHLYERDVPKVLGLGYHFSSPVERTEEHHHVYDEGLLMACQRATEMERSFRSGRLPTVGQLEEGLTHHSLEGTLLGRCVALVYMRWAPEEWRNSSEMRELISNDSVYKAARGWCQAFHDKRGSD